MSTQNKPYAVLGFDGFVDEITYVVDVRESPDRYTRIKSMKAFGDRISRSAGKSMNLEYVTAMTKMGGNGTIMANALSLLGVDLTCIGTMGIPEFHPVYQDMSSRIHAVSLGSPARTEALEFDDGKIITSKLEALDSVTWDRITEIYPLQDLIARINGAALFAPMNWTMLPHMGSILKKLADFVVPELSPGRTRYLYADFADPEKRRPEDLKDALETLSRFSPAFQVVLGANAKELELVCSACGIPATGSLHNRGRRLADHLGFSMIVVHSREDAACIRESEEIPRVQGNYTPHPKISTGAGDNFNAGFCCGLISGLSDEECLNLGCEVAGYYVRHAVSPDMKALKK